MTSLYQTLRLLDKRQEEQQVAVAATRMQEQLSRQELQASAIWSRRHIGLNGVSETDCYCLIASILTIMPLVITRGVLRRFMEQEVTEVSE